MKKSDKKLENALIKKLTALCESTKSLGIGFSWLTHSGQLSPLSLRITCVFLTNEQLKRATDNGDTKVIEREIQYELNKFFGKISNRQLRINFDTEETCQLSHNGNWQQRLQQIKH